MQRQATTVLLAEVRADFAHAMQNLQFQDWLPSERVFLEDPHVVGSPTLPAVHQAYQQLGTDLCERCPRRASTQPDQGALQYMI